MARRDNPAGSAHRGALLFTPVSGIIEKRKALCVNNEPKRTKMLELIGKYHITMLEESDNSIKLVDIYIKNGVIPANKLLDARHIAIALANTIDILLSYNCKHINKLKTKTMIPALNQIGGLTILRASG